MNQVLLKSLLATNIDDTGSPVPLGNVTYEAFQRMNVAWNERMSVVPSASTVEVLSLLAREAFNTKNYMLLLFILNHDECDAIVRGEILLGLHFVIRKMCYTFAGPLSSSDFEPEFVDEQRELLLFLVNFGNVDIQHLISVVLSENLARGGKVPFADVEGSGDTY